MPADAAVTRRTLAFDDHELGRRVHLNVRILQLHRVSRVKCRDALFSVNAGRQVHWLKIKNRSYSRHEALRYRSR
jgi:hypothetical protein